MVRIYEVNELIENGLGKDMCIEYARNYEDYPELFYLKDFKSKYAECGQQLIVLWGLYVASQLPTDGAFELVQYLRDHYLTRCW